MTAALAAAPAPTLTGLAALLPSLSLRAVELAEPVVFGTSPLADLRLLRILRDATSHGVRLHWTLAGLPCHPPRTHTHLVPPVRGTGEAAGQYAADWLAAYRYGDFYYRHGPGFVTVKDVRDGMNASRMVIDEGADVFEALAAAHTVAEAGPVDPAILDVAAEAGLLLRVADEVLVLPYRMRHWPVPYAAI